MIIDYLIKIGQLLASLSMIIIINHQSKYPCIIWKRCHPKILQDAYRTGTRSVTLNFT